MTIVEEKLAYSCVSSAVKIGDTVHRETGEWTPTIHALLHFLKSKGFEYSPTVLGFDERNREVLEFLPGEAATPPWPPALLKDDGLAQAASMLKRYHAVVKDFQPASDARWRIGKMTFKRGQIIRHGDLGPWNILWQGDVLTGLIDWDFAEPGKAITDLAQMAYFSVPFRGKSVWQEAGFTKQPNFHHRLEVLCASYGQFTANEVMAEIILWLRERLKRVKQLGRQGIEPWASFLKRGDDRDILRDLAWLGAL